MNISSLTTSNSSQFLTFPNPVNNKNLNFDLIIVSPCFVYPIYDFFIFFIIFQYRAAINVKSQSPINKFLLHPNSIALQQKQRSFLTFGFGAGSNSGGPSRRESHVNVNVTPTSQHDTTNDTPEIRKYKKRFNSEILCAALWGVNLLIGTENGLMLLDRSGQGKVYQLISRRRFQQMEVLEGQNILVTISGKKNRVRVYYLSWLKSKILRTDGLSDVSNIFNCILHF